MSSSEQNVEVKPVGATLEGEDMPEKLKFEDHYELTKRLRSGSYGIVYVTHHKASSQDYAVKVIDRTKLKAKDDASVFREVSVLKDLRGIEGVIQLFDFFVQPTCFHVVQQWARGGDLFDRLADRNTYKEADARNVAKRLLETVENMHEHRYVHRDLKTENLLLRDEVDDTHVLVADFGFAKMLPKSGGLRTRCGTPAFVAPEVILGVPYNQAVDMWGVGVILYLLLGGYAPFRDDNHRGLFRKIRAADFVFHEAYWENVSIEAKKLISSLLVVDPDYRLTAKQALDSDWMHMKKESLSERDLSSSLTEMKSFNAKRSLKSAVDAVRWAMTANFWNPDNVTFAKQMNEWDEAFNQEVGQSRLGASAKKEKKLSFKDSYELKTKIRKGSHATVWECVHRATGDEYAVKVIGREGLTPSDDEAVLNEVALVQSLECQYIVQFVDFYEEADCFYLVMEHMKGGDVFDRIVKKSRYNEKDARDLVRILLKAVKFMHSKGVAHRDLKPQNLLLKSDDDDADIKVGDFGFARRVHTPQSLTTRCGTPSYVAPEILKNVPHDTAADMWSIGVICYVLLVGYPPFMEENQKELFRKIRAGEYEFIKDDWKNVSKDARDLIRGLLVVDPLRRLTAEEALKNKWIMESDESLSCRDLSDSLKVLKERKSRLRSFARAVMWLGRSDKAVPRVLLPTANEESGSGGTADSQVAEKSQSKGLVEKV